MVTFVLSAAVAHGPPAHASPSNDAYADAIALTGSLPLARTGDNNLGATMETGEPAVIGVGKSVWYTWTAPATRDYTVDTCDSDFNSQPWIYGGSSLASLTFVKAADLGCPNPGGTIVTFLATAGTVYSIAVYGLDDGPTIEEGTFDLNVTQGPGGFYLASPSHREGNRRTTNLPFTIHLGASYSHPVSVHFFTADCPYSNCATQGIDYIGTHGVVKFKAGSRSARFVVLVKGDRAIEGDERFEVFLTTPSGAPIVEGHAAATIRNDDFA